NTLALRADTSGDPTFLKFLQRTALRTFEAQEHQGMPFEHVVDAVRPPRSLSHSPIFQVMFAWMNAPKGRLTLPGIQVSHLELPKRSGLGKFDLTLSLREENRRIVGRLEYATALFESDTIARYIRYFERILEAVVDSEGQ